MTTCNNRNPAPAGGFEEKKQGDICKIPKHKIEAQRARIEKRRKKELEADIAAAYLAIGNAIKEEIKKKTQEKKEEKQRGNNDKKKVKKLRDSHKISSIHNLTLNKINTIPRRKEGFRLKVRTLKNGSRYKPYCKENSIDGSVEIKKTRKNARG